MIHALVSIGTNSTRLLVVDGDRRVTAESRGTRLGTGIGVTGTIDAAARERTLAAVDEYLAIARTRGVDAIDAIATSALRRASDGEAFRDAVASRVGIPPRVLSGEEEATYSFLGATATHAADHGIAVLDVGGGSSELAVDSPAHARASGTVRRVFSREIGAVRLAERHRDVLGARALGAEERTAIEAAARSDAAAILAPYATVRGFDELIVVGGTAFTAAAMLTGGLHDGARMTRAACRRLIAELLERELEARKRLPHIRPQRADILPAGLIIIDEACRLLGVEAFTVSESDLLLGYMMSSAYRAVPFAPEPRA